MSRRALLLRVAEQGVVFALVGAAYAVVVGESVLLAVPGLGLGGGVAAVIQHASGVTWSDVWGRG